MTKPLNYTPFKISACRWCGTDFLFPCYHGGQKQFCSSECRRAAKAKREADFRQGIRPVKKEATMVTRTCLKCSLPFESWGKSNRICKSCREDNHELARSYSSIALTGERRSAI